jgi:Na+/H+ antiporter NhaA
VLFSILPIGEQRWIANIVSLICAVGVGWFVWVKLGSAPQGLISSTLIGSVCLGGIGFCVGFFGPIIFSSDSNQGPLLGILFTGPLGFILGGIAGVLYWVILEKKLQK